MPEWIVPVAAQTGVGAVLALWALHMGWWYPSSTVEFLKRRIDELSSDLENERKEHRQDVAEGERRLFNALGVAEKVTRIVEHAASRRRVA